MLERHDLVWLNARGWQVAIAQAQPAAVPQLWRWRERDWPAIVRTRDADYGADELALEVFLPPSHHVALRTVQDGVARSRRSLPLREILAQLPPGLAQRLQAFAEQPDPPFEGAGLLALQALTGQHYLADDTSCALNVRPSTHAELEQCLRNLDALGHQHACNIEIIFPSGHGVSWPEWRAARTGRTHMMATDSVTVRLMHVWELLRSLD